MSYRLALIDLPGVIALLMNIALQYDASLEKAVELLTGVKFEPCGLVPSTMESITVQACQIYLAGICCMSTAVEMHWPMLQP